MEKRMLTDEDKLVRKYDIHKKYKSELTELQKQKGILPIKEYNKKLNEIKLKYKNKMDDL